MNEYKSWKILQIIPAQAGWKAVHCQELEDRQIEISNRPIICWALVEPLGESTLVRTQVRGIEQESSELAVVEDLINTKNIREDGTDRNQYFLGYNDPEAHKESRIRLTIARQASAAGGFNPRWEGFDFLTEAVGGSRGSAALRLRSGADLSGDRIFALKGRPAFFLLCLTLLPPRSLVPLLLLAC